MTGVCRVKNTSVVFRLTISNLRERGASNTAPGGAVVNDEKRSLNLIIA